MPDKFTKVKIDDDYTAYVSHDSNVSSYVQHVSGNVTPIGLLHIAMVNRIQMLELELLEIEIAECSTLLSK